MVTVARTSHQTAQPVPVHCLVFTDRPLLRTQPAGPKITLHFLGLYLCMYLCASHLLRDSGNARSEQLLMMPTELLTNREWLPGEVLNGL